MSRQKPLAIILLLCAMFTGCSHMSDKRYLVSVYQQQGEQGVVESTVVESAITAFYSKTQALLAGNRGHYLDAPIIISKALPNPAQPAYTARAPGNVIFIAEFPDRKHLNAYLKNPEVLAQMNSMAQSSQQERVFMAKEFNPMGMLPAHPAVGQFERRAAPAFIMVNDIAMKSFLNPLTPYRITRYMNINFPNLKNAEVKMMMPFEKVTDIRGNYPYEVLFMSEWSSEEAFNEFHQQDDFIQLTKTTRNKAFSAFTESKAQIMNIGQINE